MSIIAKALEVVDELPQEVKEAEAEVSPAPGDAPTAIFPRDSILTPFLDHAAGVCEAPPHIVLGCLLSVCAGILQRRVSVLFDRPKFANLFSIVVSRAGGRKGGAVSLVSTLAKEILGTGNVICGSVSEEALFESYADIPDRLWIESEGNSLLHNWGKTHYGEGVSRRVLKLYDCEDWSQRFKGGKAQSEAKHIPATSTSLLIATTFSGCRFNGLSAGDGLRRRFLYYVASKRGSRIYWPEHRQQADWERVIRPFRQLVHIKGEFPALNPSHMVFPLWRKIQDKIDERDAKLGPTLEEEAIGHALNEAASHTLKLAMIFQICRHLADRSRPALDWDGESLQLAFDHVMQCIAAQEFIGRYAVRFATAEEAEAVYSVVVTEAPEKAGDPILRTQTDLTRRFAANPSRAGAMKPSDLHGRIMPFLIADGRATIVKQEGKLTVYRFNPDSKPDG